MDKRNELFALELFWTLKAIGDDLPAAFLERLQACADASGRVEAGQAERILRELLGEEKGEW